MLHIVYLFNARCRTLAVNAERGRRFARNCSNKLNTDDGNHLQNMHTLVNFLHVMILPPAGRSTWRAWNLRCRPLLPRRNPLCSAAVVVWVEMAGSLSSFSWSVGRPSWWVPFPAQRPHQTWGFIFASTWGCPDENYSRLFMSTSCAQKLIIGTATKCIPPFLHEVQDVALSGEATFRSI